MTTRDYLLSATNITQINSITYQESMSLASANAKIKAASHTQTIGGLCTVAGGYTDEQTTFIKSGYVKNIEYNRPDQMYTIDVFDALSLAVDYFIVPDDPANPTQYIGDKLMETVIGEVLAMASLTNYAFDASSPSLYPGSPSFPYQLVNLSAWDSIESMSRIAVYYCFVDNSGSVPVVNWRNRPPYIVGGDVSTQAFTTGASGNILKINYALSDEKMRNRVVVRGAPGISYIVTGANIYLPTGYYKTLLIDTPIIANDSDAAATGLRNLTTFNRLTETLSLTSIGIPSVKARAVVAVTEPFTGLNNDLFIAFSATHRISQSGYELDLTLVR